MRTFSKGKCSARQMLQMYLVQKCLFAKQHNARQIDAPSNKNVTSKKEGFL